MDRDRPPSIDYRAFLESTPLVPWEFDACSRRMAYVGPQAEALLGYPVDTWLEQAFWTEHVLPDDQAAVEEARSALLTGGGCHVIEYRMEHMDGHLVWVSEAASAVDVGGRLCCIRGLTSDVTEKRRLEASLAEGEDRLRAILRGAPDAMILTDSDGTILNINDQAQYLFGYTLREIQGSTVDLLLPEGLRRRLAEHREAFHRDPARLTLVDGQSFTVEGRDAEKVPVELSVSRIPLAAGSQLLYSIRDLTVRERVEGQLRASEARIRGMANALPALVCFVGSDRRYRFVNAAYAAWARRDRSKIEGRPVRDVMGENVYREARPFIEAALAGEAVHYFADVTGPTGAVSRVDVSYVPHRVDGAVDGYFVVVVDVGFDAENGGADVKDFRLESFGAEVDSDDPDQPPGGSLRVS